MSDLPFPAICIKCGQQHGRFDPRSPSVGSFWIGECNWCSSTSISVTDPADYGHPKLPEAHK